MKNLLKRNKNVHERNDDGDYVSEVFWADKSAQQVIERAPDAPRYITECGLGASGIPHVGSVGDGIRSYVVTLAIQDKGYDSLFQAYSDDRDGLRKIPYGFPSSLREYVGNPVSHIPDPFGCHDSFGRHISSLLTDAFDDIGIAYRFQSSDDAYKDGMLDAEILTLLERSQEAGALIREVTGQEKYLGQYPYFAICEECGKIYTTRVTGFDRAAKTVTYACDGEFVGKDSTTGEDIPVKGCGHVGTTSIRNGKLAWKVEFAARWKAFDVAFEAFGKDILESVKVNDLVGERILGYTRPVHAFYEMFVERGGGKISKSKGNVFTPQKWLTYGSPQSLVLLMLKRLAYSRVVDLEEIPKLMDEVDYLQSIYFNRESIKNEREREHVRRLYEYVMFKDIPATPLDTVPYGIIANIAAVLPASTPNREDIIMNILENSGKLPKKTDDASREEVLRRIGYATSWVQDAGTALEHGHTDMTEAERAALADLSERIDESMDPEALQGAVFSCAQDHGVKPAAMFKLLYLILLGVPRGPKAGTLVSLIGVPRERDLIAKELALP